MIRVKAGPPSGRILIMYGYPINDAPRDLLLQIIEHYMAKGDPRYYAPGDPSVADIPKRIMALRDHSKIAA